MFKEFHVKITKSTDGLNDVLQADLETEFERLYNDEKDSDTVTTSRNSFLKDIVEPESEDEVEGLFAVIEAKINSIMSRKVDPPIMRFAKLCC